MLHARQKTDTPGAEEPLLSVEGVQIGYTVAGAYNVAVDDASFEIRPGEKVMLLGPSGCGKSTLLKAVAGFLKPDDGTITFAGTKLPGPGPDRAVVFQEFDQLFPWRTVLGNVSYPLRVVGWSKRQADAKAQTFVEMMGLTHARERYPHQLSGGMKQRVAIARALALEPRMLLMDEPFGSLDAQTRSRLQRELKVLAQQTGLTILFVTHSIQEALVLGDRVVVLGDAPSTLQDDLDVGHIQDFDSEEMVEVRRRLRALLSKDAEVEHAFAE